MNLYPYVENNPTTLGDADGHVPCFNGACDLPWSDQGGGGPWYHEFDPAFIYLLALSEDRTAIEKAQGQNRPILVPPIIVNVSAVVDDVPVWFRWIKWQAIGLAATNMTVAKAAGQVISAALTGAAKTLCGCDTTGGRTEHDKEQAGEPNREVGDPNRVIREGKKYTDTDSGYTVHVSGDRVVITDPNDGGKIVTRFVNSAANTADRVAGGKWIPQ